MKNLGINGSPSKERIFYDYSIRASEGFQEGVINKRGSLPPSQHNKDLMAKGKHPM